MCALERWIGEAQVVEFYRQMAGLAAVKLEGLAKAEQSSI